MRAILIKGHSHFAGLFLWEGAMHKVVNHKPVKTWIGEGKRKVSGGAKAYTKINVKPYAVIVRAGKILCGGERKIPLVFDTKVMAVTFAQINGLGECDFREMELEELVHICRDPKVNFNSFYLIDDQSQITA